MRTTTLFIIAVLASAGSALAVSPIRIIPPPTLVVSGTTIGVDGLTPEGPVLFFAIQHIPRRSGSAVRRVEQIVTNTTEEGHAELTNVPDLTTAVWCAIDLTTGRSTLSTPAEYQLRTSEPSAGALKQTVDGHINRFTAPRTLVEGVLVRPGGGAWGFTAGDGAAGDADGQVNGRVECQTDQMRPIGASGPPPGWLLPSDIIIVIDPVLMDVTVVEVPL
jgi:hypothetical protein